METAQLTARLSPDGSRLRPSPLACIQCRKRHLKCNGKPPECGRCRARGSECIYEESRRGYKKTKKTPADHSICDNGIGESDSRGTSSITASSGINAVVWAPTTTTRASDNLESIMFLTKNLMSNSYCEPQFIATDVMSRLNAGTEAVLDAENAMSTNKGAGIELTGGSPNGTTEQDVVRPITISFPGVDAYVEPLMDIYYRSFNNAHPFIIPRRLYREKPALLPPHLTAVILFIASHFVSYMPQENLRNAAENITSELIQDDGFKVQGLILFGMSLYARCETEQAVAVIHQAIDLALDLGMHRSTFVLQHGMNNTIIEESWRRTWWELYTMDGILATLNGAHYSSRLHDVQSNVALPCEASHFSLCKGIPPLRTQNDFLQRTFAEEPYEYSSMAYKIEAIRLSGKVVSFGEDGFASSNDCAESIEASLAGLLLSMPPQKRHIIERNGEVDEILFSVHNIIDCALIMLHRSKSDLVLIRNHYLTPCSRQQAISATTSAQEIHTSKAIRAANAICNAVTIRKSLAMHSPCFICALTLAATVHLPAYAMQARGDVNNAIKERAQLSVRALSSIGETWPLAKVVSEQISQFAREMIYRGDRPPNSSEGEVQVASNVIESISENEAWFDDLSYLGPFQI